MTKQKGRATRRRELMLLLGGAMTAPRTLSAQQKAMPVIGYLSSSSPRPSKTFLAAFHQGLSETGYVEKYNAAIEYRWAEGRYDRLSALATDLVDRKVDVIAAMSGSPTPGREMMHWQRRLAALFVFLALVGCASLTTGPGKAPNAPYQQGDPRDTSGMH